MLDEASEISARKRMLIFSSNSNSQDDMPPEALESISSEIVVWERSIEEEFVRLEELDADIGVEFNAFEKKTRGAIEKCIGVWDSTFRTFGRGIAGAGVTSGESSKTNLTS